jgi:hypothetical protein
MKGPIISYVGWLLVVAAFGFYVYGIYEAIILSWKETDIGEGQYPEMLSTSIGAIQALLLANLGILLGISIARPKSSVAKSLMLNSSKEKAVGSIPPPPLEIKDKIQLFALVIYIFSLIACLITWGHDSFLSDSKKVVSIISESGKMFIGVVLAYLTAVLSNNNL